MTPSTLLPLASFIIDGITLHTLLHLPTRGEFKELEGNRLLQLQEVMSTIRYIVIDEMSMVGRKVFGEIDRRLRQTFPHRAQEVFGGCSILLFGDFGHQSWTSPSTRRTPAQTSQTREELPTSSLTRHSLSHGSCVKLAKIPSRFVSDASSEKC